MHESAAAALGLRCHYQLIEVAGADRDALRAMLEGVRGLGFAGVNITFPYKEAVVELLDELAPGAAAMQAVNTVAVRDGRLIGHNTDSTGFARAAADLVAGTGRKPVAIIGAGGVGKAIAFALASLGVSEIRVFDSARAKAGALAALLGGRSSIVVTDSVEAALRSRGTPVPDALLHPGLWVADAVYSPLYTPLLKAAKAKGARIMTGRDLAICQAADAFELFTGLVPSIDVIGAAFDAVMAERTAAASRSEAAR